MTILFVSSIHGADAWTRAIHDTDPSIEVRVYPDTGNVADIVLAIAWKPPKGLLASLPNLKIAQCIGAGVDHIIHDDTLPPDLAIGRVIEERLTVGMSEYVLLAVLRQHRQLDRMMALQRERRWEWFMPNDTTATTVGILGLGELGAAAGRHLAALGFRVTGWSRTRKEVAGIKSFAGPDELFPFLNECDHLVCLLPLTPDTRGILNARTLSALKPGAHVVNAGRGGHLVEADLIPLLDSGQLGAATLDVFATEPLPADHPFWTHPKILVTPHNASDSLPHRVAPLIVENYRRALSGRPFLHLVDRNRGY